MELIKIIKRLISNDFIHFIDFNKKDFVLYDIKFATIISHLGRMFIMLELHIHSTNYLLQKVLCLFTYLFNHITQ